jgi:hypothetical protein
MIACLLWHFKLLSDKLVRACRSLGRVSDPETSTSLAACPTVLAATGLTKQPASLTKSIHFVALPALQGAMLVYNAALITS